MKISHIIMYILLITNYMIIPIANLGLAVFFIVDPSYDLKN